ACGRSYRSGPCLLDDIRRVRVRRDIVGHRPCRGAASRHGGVRDHSDLRISIYALHLADGGRHCDAGRDPVPSVRFMVAVHQSTISKGPDMSKTLGGARGVKKRVGAVVAADEVTVEIRPREILGVIGANGAGKTTFV